MNRLMAIAAVPLLLLTAPGSSRPLAKIRRDILIVAVRTGPLPFGVAPSGADKGLDLDLVAVIAKGIGVNFRTIVTQSPAEAQDLLSQDKVDLVIGGVRATPHLRDTYQVSSPYYRTGLGILTLRSNQDLFTLSDLEAKPVAATPESGADKLLESFLSKSRLEMVRGIPDGVEMLQRGEVQAIIGDLATLSAMGQKSPSFRVLDVSLTQDEFVLLANRKSAGLIDAVNDQIRMLRTSASEQEQSPLGALCAKYRLSETINRIVRPGTTSTARTAPTTPSKAGSTDGSTLDARVQALEAAVSELREKLEALQAR